MNSFSISRALGAGFGLIGRRPVAVLAWGFLYFAIAVVPMAVLMALFAPSLFTAASGAGPDPAAMAGLTVIQPISWITTIVANAVVFNAIYRSVLEPQREGLNVRFGAAELWQGLVQVALFVMMMIAAMVAVLALVIVFGAAIFGALASGGDAGQAPAIGLGGVLVGFALLIAFWLVALRFALAGPMTLADRQFRLFESWTLTKGQTLRLFGLSLLIVLLVILLYLAVMLAVGLLFGVGAVGLGASLGGEGLEDLFAGGGAIALIIPLLLLALVFGCAVYGMFLAVVVAPWAEVYRQLSGRTVDAETFA